MNIIIVGCGKVGSALAEQLAGEGHDVTVIDTNPDAIKRVMDVADVMGVEGNGLVHMVQEEAGIKYADMFISMTASDEMNLLCCLIAKKASSCRTIARVRKLQPVRKWQGFFQFLPPLRLIPLQEEKLNCLKQGFLQIRPL